MLKLSINPSQLDKNLLMEECLMNLDQRTIVVTQISAAVACNALAALRVAVTEAITLGLTPEEIQEILALAKDIQQQPISHVTHLIDQLLREPKKTSHKHSAHCGCGGHHA
jgi:hypothetical protein